MRNCENTASLRVVPSGDTDDDILVEDHHPLVPDGMYVAKYIGHVTAMMFGRAPKCFLRFEIMEGPHSGVQVVRPFRVRALKGRPGPNGKFTLSAGGDFYRMLAKLFGTRDRPDRISIRGLKHMLFRIHTRTVTYDRTGAPLAEGTRYSVIDAIEDGR